MEYGNWIIKFKITNSK